MFRRSYPVAGALKYIARDFGISYSDLIVHLCSLGFMEQIPELRITESGYTNGMYDFPDGGFGADENIISQVAQSIEDNTLRCQGCGCRLQGQGVPFDADHWVCLKCGYDNIF